MEQFDPRSSSASDSLEMFLACQSVRHTVNEALQTMQTCALDVRDAVMAAQRFRESLQLALPQPEIDGLLQHSIEYGLVLIQASMLSVFMTRFRLRC
jgi:hypothetical protein